MDQEIMKKFFPYVDNNYGKHDEIHDVITIVENMTEKDPEKEKLDQTQQIIKKYDHEQEDRTENEYLLESFKKTFHQEIFVFFDKFIEQFEIFLNSMDLKSYKAIAESEEFLFFKTNVWGDFAKFRLSGVRANSKTKAVDLRLKNAFETHGIEINICFCKKYDHFYDFLRFLLLRSRSQIYTFNYYFFLKYDSFHDF